ncbi:MAG: hypothetical protein L0Z62_47430 [Gemmataceae bacterium]|nr:hypothetical protein [Gemmataceae bacterium]
MDQNGRQEPPQFAGYVDELRTDHPDLARAFAGFKGIDDVLGWMGSRTRTDIDIVGMDEFHYDFLVRLDDSGRWLAFGVT